MLRDSSYGWEGAKNFELICNEIIHSIILFPVTTIFSPQIASSLARYRRNISGTVPDICWPSCYVQAGLGRNYGAYFHLNS
jgi:hypothetical protein